MTGPRLIHALDTFTRSGFLVVFWAVAAGQAAAHRQWLVFALCLVATAVGSIIQRQAWESKVRAARVQSPGAVVVTPVGSTLLSGRVMIELREDGGLSITSEGAPVTLDDAS